MWVLLLLPFVGLLWVPFYNFQEPALFGFPFFYWYQLAWIPLVAILGTVSYLLVRKPAPSGRGAHRADPRGADESR